MIIVIEGLPGTGKTTICQRINSELNYNFVPQRTADFFIAEKKLYGLEHREKLYFFNDEAKSALATNYINNFPETPVIMDRYYISTLAYNYAASKLSNNKSFYQEALHWYKKSINKELIKPDLYVYLVTTPNTSLKLKSRKSSNEFWSNPKALHVMDNYYSLFFPKVESEINVVKINVADDRDRVYMEVLNAINKRV